PVTAFARVERPFDHVVAAVQAGAAAADHAGGAVEERVNGGLLGWGGVEVGGEVHGNRRHAEGFDHGIGVSPGGGAGGGGGGHHLRAFFDDDADADVRGEEGLAFAGEQVLAVRVVGRFAADVPHDEPGPGGFQRRDGRVGEERVVNTSAHAVSLSDALDHEERARADDRGGGVGGVLRPVEGEVPGGAGGDD